ncbi:hypothetical protein CL617_03470 [archaeon]|nr:hypothetical protein [archaeon]|tara:strand:- start:14933 stop:15613 length:681 start_codon:yes stop_codon:yes gene_type:complete
MKYENILFDFGDTLVQLDPSKEDVFLNVLKRHNIKIKKEEMKKAFLFYIDMKTSVLTLKNEEEKKEFLIGKNKKILIMLGIKNNIEQLAIEINSEFKKAHWVLFPEVISVLEKLKEKGFRLGILSNWESVLHELCKNLDITHYFDFIVASADVGLEKPDPEFFRTVLSKNDMDAEKTVYVGNDYEQDIISSGNLGIKPILFDKDDIYAEKDCDKIRDLNDIFSLLE